jgi:alpha-1,6-mannosyltransferase
LVAGVVALHVLFALAPPLLSTDIFSYVDYARLGAVHHINPYSHGPVFARQDPAFAYVGHMWKHTPTVYGPLFTLPTYPLALLGVPAAMWSLKLLAAAASLLCVWLVWRCAQRLDRSPALAVALVGLNPVLLVYGVGGGHNDMIMLALMLAAVALALSERPASAGVAAVGAAAIKVTGAAVLPFMLLGRVPTRRLLAGAVIAAVAAGGLALIVFGGHAFDFISGLYKIQRRLTTISSPNEISGLFGAKASSSGVRLGAHIALLAALLWLLWLTWRQRMHWVVASGWALLALSLTTTWQLAWYTLWALPFAAITQDRRLIAGTLLLEAVVVAHELPGLLT